jgi:hypothetical protein
MSSSLPKSTMVLSCCNLRTATWLIQLFGTTGKYYVMKAGKSETKDMYTKK